MAFRDLFSHGKKISRKNLRNDYRKDRLFQKEVAGNPSLKAILDRPEELKEFHDKLVKKADHGPLKGDDIREVMYDLAHGEGKNISSEEGRKVASEIFPDSSRRYRAEKPDLAKTEVSEKKKAAGNISANIRSRKAAPTYLAYRISSRFASSDPKGGEKKKYSYFDTLRKIISRQNQKS